MTLRELGNRSGVSPSHLGRIERGERFPSAHILGRIAKPLGFEENELFMLADYLPQRSFDKADSHESYYKTRGLDPYVAMILAQQPVEVQRAVIGVLTILESLARNTREA
jgi:transcriptional regulator with XRE-family HTH domain